MKRGALTLPMFVVLVMAASQPSSFAADATKLKGVSFAEIRATLLGKSGLIESGQPFEAEFEAISLNRDEAMELVYIIDFLAPLPSGSSVKVDGLIDGSTRFKARVKRDELVLEGFTFPDERDWVTDFVTGLTRRGVSDVKLEGFVTGYVPIKAEGRLRIRHGTPSIEGKGLAQNTDEKPSAGGAREFRSRVNGTGFLVSPDGLLLTNFHVISHGERIMVTCPEHLRSEAKIVKASRWSDLALIKISSSGLPHLSLASARSVSVGDAVFTVGFPVMSIQGDEAKFTDGVVSSLSGYQGDAMLLQTTTPIQPGNSGGALVNNQGHVVGVVSGTARPRFFLARAGALPQNINWAVKTEYALPLLDQVVQQPPTMSRKEAIERATKATCLVEVGAGTAAPTPSAVTTALTPPPSPNVARYTGDWTGKLTFPKTASSVAGVDQPVVVRVFHEASTLRWTMASIGGQIEVEGGGQAEPSEGGLTLSGTYRMSGLPSSLTLGGQSTGPVSFTLERRGSSLEGSALAPGNWVLRLSLTSSRAR